jgi:hypothetical protein
VATINSYFDFHLILLGAANWVAERQNQSYVPPDITAWALHRLHARQIQREETPTVSHQQTMLYLTQSLNDLFDTSELPSELPMESILDNFPNETVFDLADGVSDYLASTKLDQISNIASFINEDENAAAKSVKDRLKKQYEQVGLSVERRSAIEDEYVKWRSFFTVINNIITPDSENSFMLDSFWQNMRDEYYEPTSPLHSRIVEIDSNGNQFYLLSQHCGLLYRNRSGRFEPITYSKFEGIDKVTKRPVTDHDFILKQTHQRRILIPGIPEMWLYEQLKQHPSVKSVHLYPGIDRYDLRVEFKTGLIDAIDIKDHSQPYSLQKILSYKNALPHIDDYEREQLRFDRFFFLIPQFRVSGKGFPNRLHDLQQLAKRHNDLFIQTIETYLQEL